MADNYQRDSQSFDRVAALYDAYRPGYPDALFEAICGRAGLSAGSQLLEIGSGTGIATLPFARRGCSILCIEPGKNLLAVAEEKLRPFPNVRWANATFEAWEPAENAFDLVFSAQAFHWTSPETRYRKTAAALKPGGYLALFWNRDALLEDRVQPRLQVAYDAITPELEKPRVEDIEQEIQQWTAEIAASGLYEPAEIRRFPWSKRYTRQEYLGVLNTYSDHLALSEERRLQLFDAIGEVIDREGGSIEKPYQAVAHLARKRG